MKTVIRITLFSILCQCQSSRCHKLNVQNQSNQPFLITENMRSPVILNEDVQVYFGHLSHPLKIHSFNFPVS